VKILYEEYKLNNNVDKYKPFYKDPYMLLVMIPFFDKTILEYFVVIISKLPYISLLSFFVRPVLYISLSVLYLQKNRFKVSYTTIKYMIVPIFFISAILFTCIIYPDNEEYIADALIEDILPCLPFFIIGLMFVADKRMMTLMGKFSVIAILVNVLYMFYYMKSRQLNEDSMYWSYLLLPHVLFSIWLFFEERKIIYMLFPLIGLFYLFSMGTRGSIVVMTIYFIINIWLKISHKIYQRIITTFLLGIMMGVLYQSEILIDFVYTIKNFLDSLGVSTRIMDSFISHQFISYTSGRDEIYEILIQKISENPLLGYGVYGEWNWGFHSAHNMYLELFVHYGIVLGGLLLFLGIFTVARAYLKTKNFYSKDLIVLWSTFIFVQGFFGGSYLRYSVFFLIAFCMKEIHISYLSKNILKNNNDFLKL
jgi:O-antigen ligase